MCDQPHPDPSPSPNPNPNPSPNPSPSPSPPLTLTPTLTLTLPLQVCDQPHPVVIKRAIAACIAADFDAACSAGEALSKYERAR